MKEKKFDIRFVYAAIIGILFEVLYFIIGDLGVDKICDYFGKSIHPFFSYIIIVFVAVIISLYVNYDKAKDLSRVLCGVIAVLSALILHFLFLRHDSIVYYHIHGEFMPIVDDLGYFFFIAYLGAAYLVWIPVSIYFVFRKKKIIENNK